MEREEGVEYFKGIIWFSGERKKDQSPPTDCKRGIMENWLLISYQ